MTDHIWRTYGGVELFQPSSTLPAVSIVAGYRCIELGSAELVSWSTGEAMLLLGVTIEHDWITWKNPPLTAEDLARHGNEHQLIASWLDSGLQFTLTYDRVIIEHSTAAWAEAPRGCDHLFTLTKAPISQTGQQNAQVWIEPAGGL